MSISGYPSRPTITLANALAIGAGASVEKLTDCGNAQYAHIEWVCDQTHTMQVESGGQPGDSAPANHYDGVTNLVVSGASALTNGRAMLVRLGGAVGTLGVKVTNTSGSAGTFSVFVTLSY